MDSSFLKLYKNDFYQAVMNDNILAYATRYNGFVQMLPNETFIQITNLESNIAFGGNLRAELVNECNELVRDITTLFFYTEFTDIYGIRQIKYQFGNIGTDYYSELLFLRLTHTVSDDVWYSAGFFVTYDSQEFTSIFHYGNKGYFKGISYDKQFFEGFSPQVIRLTCFKTDKNPRKEGEEYTELSGNVASSRSIITKIDKYLFYYCDFFTHDRLVILLDHEIIYVNGYRISNKPMPEKDDRTEDANTFQVTFEANPTEEKLPNFTQLPTPFKLLTMSPFGTYTDARVPNVITGSFNYNIVLGTGFLTVFDITAGTILANFTEADIDVVDNGFSIDISALLPLDHHLYYIAISAGLFYNSIGETIIVEDETAWPFNVRDGIFNPAQFNNAQFLIA